MSVKQLRSFWVPPATIILNRLQGCFAETVPKSSNADYRWLFYGPRCMVGWVEGMGEVWVGMVSSSTHATSLPQHVRA